MEDDKSLKKFWIAAVWPMFMLVVMWVIWYLDVKGNLKLYEYGIYPNELSGLKGILFSPWLHDTRDAAHIINNSVPLLVLGWALFYFYRDIAWKIFLLIWLVGGLCVWIAAAPPYHIGMSGILYGLAGFLFFSGVIRMNKSLLAISLLVAFEYGGMVWGVFPYKAGMSWEGHLWGAVVGITMAVYYRKSGPQKKQYRWEVDEEEEERRIKEQEAKYGQEYWKIENLTEYYDDKAPTTKPKKLNVRFIYRPKSTQESSVKSSEKEK